MKYTRLFRLRNTLLLGGAYLRFLVQGRATRVTRDPKVILVVQTGKLGDMVCTTPMFRAIKKKYPDARVVVAGNAINKQVLAHNEDVDDYVVYREDDLPSFVEAVRAFQVEYACATGPNFGILAALYKARVPAICVPEVVNGFCPIQTRPYRLLRKLVITRPHRMGTYAPREYLRLLEPLGIEDADTTKHLSFSSEAQAFAQQLYEDHGLRPRISMIIGIAPGAGAKIKQWPPERFPQLMDRIATAYPGVKFLLFGTAVDVPIAELIQNQGSRERKDIDLVGKLTIDQLKAVIAQLDYFIAVDTGPLYIAEAFKVPTVDILGPVDEHEQSPRAPGHISVYLHDRKSPAIHIMNASAFDEDAAREQVNGITVAMVDDAFRSLVRSPGDAMV